MTSHIFYDANENAIGKIVLPVRDKSYTKTEIKQAFLERCINNKTINFWVINGFHDIAIKINAYSLIETVLKSCCDRCGVSANDYHLKHGDTILPVNRHIGLFVDNNDRLQMVQNIY